MLYSRILRNYTFLQKCHFCVENNLAWMSVNEETTNKLSSGGLVIKLLKSYLID